MIGIIPAAGTAKRIHGLPKFLLPIPNGYLLDVLCQRMAALIYRWVIVTNEDNERFIKRYAPQGTRVIIRNTATMSESVMTAHRDMWKTTDPTASVVFGMPDTYFDDEQAFTKLAAALDSGADVAVGVFRARADQHNGGMCRLDGEQVVEVVDKPEHTDLRWIWGVLAWKPAFWGCLDADMPHVGYGLPRAIESGLDVRAVRLEGQYYDCGTFEGYFECLQHITARSRVVEVASWLA